jgi:hypothetical protein
MYCRHLVNEDAVRRDDMGVRPLAVFVVIAGLTVACAPAVVVNSGETPPRTETPTAAAPTARVDPNLVDAHAYYMTSDDVKGYYFTTPSGKWSCAILPRSQAGCQAAGSQVMSVSGRPDTVEGPNGAVAPNAIAVGDGGDPGFTWLDRPGFSATTGKALVLDFGRTLAAAGFRCNVQESGVSCEDETTRKGFAFSATGYVSHYTPVPG